MTSNRNNDLVEILYVFLLAGLITWIPFFLIEVYSPAVDKMIKYEQDCKDRGGFVFNEQNKEKICIKEDYIVIL